MLVMSLHLAGLLSCIAQNDLGDISINYTDSEEQGSRMATDLLAESGSVVQLQMADFTIASARSMPAVVHINTTRKNSSAEDNRSQIFSYLEKDRSQQPVITSGSGVIISSDGYIVTNYHVVKDAKILQITLQNKKTYEAELVGRDPNTDLALIKVNDYGLPYIRLGDSDRIKVGEWVLAVGNPFNLASTVTAGIISAKGRNLDILDADNAIESFIQTDAVVNQGNSGGALVNINGELIGINTVIYSTQGGFAGYSFAIPVNLVKKVVTDLREYRTVQRAFMGVTMRNLDATLADREKIRTLDGVYVENIQAGSPAAMAGLRPGDVIFKIGESSVTNVADFQERMARFRPGESAVVGYIRQNEEYYVMLVLRNENNEMAVVKDDNIEFEKRMGIKLEDLLTRDRENMLISGGVRVYQLTAGIIPLYTTMRSGFVITKINKNPMTSSQAVISTLNDLQKGAIILIEGLYPGHPKLVYYSFYMP